jgi:secreted trypsin-like serine protease
MRTYIWRLIGLTVLAVAVGHDMARAQPPGRRPVDLVRLNSGQNAPTLEKIVNGKPAVAGEFPFQVALIASATPAGEEHRGQFCGGTLVDANWVLTAAHCVPNTGPGEVDIYVGSTILPSGPGGAAAEGGATRLHVSRVISHQEYNASNHDNDVAMLKLTAPAPAVLKPAAIATAEDASSLSAPGKKVMVIGWGATVEGGDTTPHLMKVEVTAQDRAICEMNYQSAVAGTQVTTNMWCAGEPEGGKDSCQGDSGGFIGARRPAGWVTLGAVSWGFGCARPKLFGVYTRVANYRAWALNVIQTF